MPGRPFTPIGQHGKITTKRVSPDGVKPVVYQSITRLRTEDGKLRRVKATGRSASAAENALRVALSQRRHGASSELTGSSSLCAAAELWLHHQRRLVDAGDRSPRTLETYESAWRRHVEPKLGDVRLREATAARCEAWLVSLRETVGPSMCSTARSVLSAVLAYALRMGAIDVNPVRDLSSIPGSSSRKRKPRAMTAGERTRWLEWMDAHVALPPRKAGSPPRRATTRSPERTAQIAADRALGDITRLALATGCRIGELMAISWDEVDLDAGTVEICWHLVRVKGQGLQRLEGAKSDAGERLLRLPRWAVAMLMRRQVDAPRGSYPVFPDSLGGWRDPNLVMRWIRWSRDEAGFGWVTSHVFRQTVITVLDDAGLRPREVADQAGHSRTEQTQAYMQRKIASGRAGEVLEELF